MGSGENLQAGGKEGTFISVSTHLATCPNCEGEMDVTDVGPYTRVRCPACEEEVRVKTEMGSYRLVRRIARGGMSVVFAARDLTLDREIAVKVLSEEFSADEKREADFRREARMTATVSHPNVVRVFTVGKAFGRYFIAMELVSGQSLEERMSVHGALPEDVVLGLALQVVDGLRAALSAGLLHRDIKPGNILIDESGTVRIVDFGLSLLTEGGLVRGTKDEIWATPDYVAPEVLTHDAEDHRADIYALGGTLYHALAGVPPIQEKEMTNRILREAKMHITPLKKAAPWLSSEIVQTVERAMAYDPENRFEDYEEFRISLETARVALEKKGTRVPVHGAIRAQRRDRQDAHRKGWLIGIGAVVLAALVVSIILLEKLAGDDAKSDEPKGPQLVVDPKSDPTLDPEAAQQINDAYLSARQALIDDDFVVAEELFLRVWKHEKAPVATAAWAGFEAAVAAYLDGRSSDSRQHLADLFDFVNKRHAADTVLGRRLQSAAELLTDLRFVPEERVPEVLADPYRATIFFAMALKMWEQGEWERAHVMFAKLAQDGPWPEAEWMNIYRELAQRYVTDYERLSEADHVVDGKGVTELQASIEALDQLYTSLLTRGRARFNVKVWQSDLMRRARVLKARQVEAEWWNLRKEVERVYLLQSRFAEGGAVLKEAALEGELERKQRAALLYLSGRADNFLSELRETLGPGANGVELSTREGVRYTEITGSEKGGLMVEKNERTRSLGWEEIDSRSLLNLHRILIDASADQKEKEARLQHAVAFAWLGGLRSEAVKIAQELIVSQPSFGDVWGEIVDVLAE